MKLLIINSKNMQNISNTQREIINEIHTSARRNFKRRKTIIKGFSDLWQADLVEMQVFAKQNGGYRYILVVIDCFSKYVWTEALKNKTAKVICSSFKNILQQVKYVPNNLQTDHGTEFYNCYFSELLQKYKIHHY